MFDQEDDACRCEQCTAPEPAGIAVSAAEDVAVTLERQASDNTSLDVALS